MQTRHPDSAGIVYGDQERPCPSHRLRPGSHKIHASRRLGLIKPLFTFATTFTQRSRRATHQQSVHSHSFKHFAAFQRAAFSPSRYPHISHTHRRLIGQFPQRQDYLRAGHDASTSATPTHSAARRRHDYCAHFSQCSHNGTQRCESSSHRKSMERRGRGYRRLCQRHTDGG